MAQVNVYVPDELKARLDEAQLPLSPLARDAWVRELSRAEAAEEAGEMRIDAVDENGYDVELRFEGEEVLGGSGIYRAEDGRAICVYEDGSYGVWTSSQINEMQEAFSDDVWKTLESNLGTNPSEELAEVLRTFGVKPVIRL